MASGIDGNRADDWSSTRRPAPAWHYPLSDGRPVGRTGREACPVPRGNGPRQTGTGPLKELLSDGGVPLDGAPTFRVVAGELVALRREGIALPAPPVGEQLILPQWRSDSLSPAQARGRQDRFHVGPVQREGAERPPLGPGRHLVRGARRHGIPGETTSRAGPGAAQARHDPAGATAISSKEFSPASRRRPVHRRRAPACVSRSTGGPSG